MLAWIADILVMKKELLLLRLADGVNVPEHDRRILESMAMRREEERVAEELAHKAHLAWEVERMLREQVLHIFL
jgi:hypothetical protein